MVVPRTKVSTSVKHGSNSNFHSVKNNINSNTAMTLTLQTAGGGAGGSSGGEALTTRQSSSQLGRKAFRNQENTHPGTQNSNGGPTSSQTKIQNLVSRINVNGPSSHSTNLNASGY